MRRISLTLTGMVLCCLAVAGCDKCGDPVKFNAPTVPSSCYDTPRDK